MGDNWLAAGVKHTEAVGPLVKRRDSFLPSTIHDGLVPLSCQKPGDTIVLGGVMNLSPGGTLSSS